MISYPAICIGINSCHIICGRHPFFWDRRAVAELYFDWWIGWMSTLWCFKRPSCGIPSMLSSSLDDKLEKQRFCGQSCPHKELLGAFLSWASLSQLEIQCTMRVCVPISMSDTGKDSGKRCRRLRDYTGHFTIT